MEVFNTLLETKVLIERWRVRLGFGGTRTENLCEPVSRNVSWSSAFVRRTSATEKRPARLGRGAGRGSQELCYSPETAASVGLT